MAKKTSKRAKKASLQRKGFNSDGVGKMVSKTRYMKVPDIGVVTVKWSGPSFVIHIMSGAEDNPNANEIRVSKEVLEKYLLQESIPIARVTFVTDQGSFVQHYLDKDYEPDVQRANKEELVYGIEELAVPCNLIRRMLRQLEK